MLASYTPRRPPLRIYTRTARPSWNVADLSPLEEAGPTCPTALPTQARETRTGVQIQQCSGVLIELIKLPLDNGPSVTSSTYYPMYVNGSDGNLRRPSPCWTCKRLVVCLSKALGGGHAAFMLRSSTSSCALNHKLLVVIRLFLKQRKMSPSRIKVESASLGPIRLTLKIKNRRSKTYMPDQRDERPFPWTACQNVSDDESEDRHTTQCYDLYQELSATRLGAPDLWIPEATGIPKNSSSSQCLTLAKTWLKDCLGEHPGCRTQMIPQLPRRVIDVVDGRLRLVVPEDGTRGFWVALSHCWGKTNTFKTTLNTIDSHKRGIEWDSLPQTFKDAILVTRALGVQYLWIDSLCIIQDDGGSDFEAEAAKMSGIYQDFIVTVAASCSASDCSGFLRERIVGESVALNKPGWLQSVRFRQALNHSQMIREDPIHARAWTFQETILPRRLLSFCSYEASWECETLRQCECRQIEYGIDGETSSNELGRAAFRQYARAVAEGTFHAGKHFHLPTGGPGQNHMPAVGSNPSMTSAHTEPSAIIGIYAQLLEAEAPSIDDPEAYREYFNMIRQRTVSNAIAAIRSRRTFSNQQQVDSILSSPAKLELEDVRFCAEWLKDKYLNTVAVNSFYRYWRRVFVPEYTRRAISKDSDRLIALQAIATDIYSGIQDQYLAGLWRGDLINQLCWQSVDGRNLPAENSSPSWSWSSVHGPVVPYGSQEPENNEFESKPGSMLVNDVVSVLASADSCGDVLHGSIRLSATAVEVRYIKSKETGLSNFHVDFSRWNSPGPAMSAPFYFEFSPDTPLQYQPDGSLWRSAKRDCLSSGHDAHAMSAVLLLVGRLNRIKLCVLVCGLLPHTRRGFDTYCRRLGIGTIDQSLFDSFKSHRSQSFVLI